MIIPICIINFKNLTRIPKLTLSNFNLNNITNERCYMPNIFTEMSKDQLNKEKGNQKRFNAVELQDMTKKQKITALPYDVMSIIFDHVKNSNLMTYKKSLPVVNKQWNRYIQLKNEQLQKNHVLKEIESLLYKYLLDSEKQTLRELMPNRKQLREENVARLLRMIKSGYTDESIGDLFFKLHIIINNNENLLQTDMLIKVFLILFDNGIDFNKLQNYIIDEIAARGRIGAFPAEDGEYSFVERLLISLYDSEKSKVSHKLFVTDCFLHGFENSNYKFSSRISQIELMINKLNALHGSDPVYHDELKNQLQRFENVMRSHIISYNSPILI